ncbi:DgyrCDS12598 [Dimorphilus gyrociliatus]|uniref:DgyrCDS12598 n=1 Tax=Dimorphilus gyrociliatus TaxID=2664684 RepID=A0A7I8W867_9ANNE|nr:DgyrCDS12598 [Dimorphilus gyrociliatus]
MRSNVPSTNIIFNRVSESGTQQQHPTIVGVLNKPGTVISQGSNLKRTTAISTSLGPSPKVLIRPVSTSQPIIVSAQQQQQPKYLLSPTKIITALPTRTQIPITGSPTKVTVVRSQGPTAVRTGGQNVVVKTINGGQIEQKSSDSLATKPLTVVGQPQSSTSVSKVQLVRVVSTTATTSQPTTSISSTVRPIAPATQQIHIVQKPTSYHRRILLPASTPIAIKPAVSSVASGNSLLKPITTHLTSKGQSPHILSSSGGPSANNDAMKNLFRKQENGTSVYLETSGQRPRKPCNCTKSQCLKLYCDCFANGEFCQNCNCSSCANNLNHEEERSRAIKACLDRNPLAFHPKIGKGRNGGGIRRHNKGCNCKRSNCLKNYCECYEAKVPCSMSCRCVGCKNSEEAASTRLIRSLSHDSLNSDDLAPLASVNNWTVPERPVAASVGQVGTRREVPVAELLSDNDVSDCIMMCMLNQGEESCKLDNVLLELQLAIIQEFARCLTQVSCASRKTAPNPSIAW